VVNQQLAALQLEQHPNKTWIGKAERGFDFLACHLTPETITPAMQCLKRCLEHITRLYEQGADQNRIGLCLRNWFRWLMAGGLGMAISISGLVVELVGPRQVICWAYPAL